MCQSSDNFPFCAGARPNSNKRMEPRSLLLITFVITTICCSTTAQLFLGFAFLQLALFSTLFPEFLTLLLLLLSCLLLFLFFFLPSKSLFSFFRSFLFHESSIREPLDGLAQCRI